MYRAEGKAEGQERRGGFWYNEEREIVVVQARKVHRASLGRALNAKELWNKVYNPKVINLVKIRTSFINIIKKLCRSLHPRLPPK